MSVLRRIGSVSLVAGLLMLVVALTSGTTSGAAPDQADPGGNNGTIKIDDLDLPDEDPGNEPKVDCVFQIDFFNFDEGVGNAEVTFELQAPTLEGRTLMVTGGDLTPDIGDDPAGGGTDIDAQETFTLAFTGEPQPNQGFKVKVTIEAPGSQGNDTKSKVFFVTPCEEPPEETTTVPETTVPDTTVPDTTVPETTNPGGIIDTTTTPGDTTTAVPGGTKPGDTRPGVVLGISTPNPPSASGPTVTNSSTLPRTGSNSGALAATGFALVLLGGVLVARSRSMART